MTGFGAEPPSASVNQPQLSTPIESILAKDGTAYHWSGLLRPSTILRLI
jgi:hypothetical protein